MLSNRGVQTKKNEGGNRETNSGIFIGEDIEKQATHLMRRNHEPTVTLELKRLELSVHSTNATKDAIPTSTFVLANIHA
jgi:hypothetical protein